jgi:hypothetical protein
MIDIVDESVRYGNTPDTFVSRYGPTWGYRWAKEHNVTVNGILETEPSAWIAPYAADKKQSLNLALGFWVATEGPDLRRAIHVANNCGFNCWGRFPRFSPRLRTRIPLFLPRISILVIPIPLPKSQLIVIQQRKSPHPFHAFPRIQWRHDQPHRPSMLRR